MQLPEGFLLIDKSAGMTSHDVVDCVRDATRQKRVGHAGTLDPMATGLLIVGVGREATKRFNEFVGLDKEYIATARLGAVSTTDDADGVITERHGCEIPSEARVRAVVALCAGAHEQVVPSYAAKKVGGKKLYEYARAGLPVPRVTTAIVIHAIELVSYEYPALTFRAHVSSGTYIRAIARDMGEMLGTGAYLTALRRTKIGAFMVEDAEPVPNEAI